VLAYDYPMAGAFWTLTLLAFWVLWVFSVIWCFIDNFRRHDHHGLAKGLWFLGLLFFPVAGVFGYLVSRPFPRDDERL
jgi:hypothetical protein